MIETGENLCTKRCLRRTVNKKLLYTKNSATQRAQLCRFNSTEKTSSQMLHDNAKPYVTQIVKTVLQVQIGGFSTFVIFFGPYVNLLLFFLFSVKSNKTFENLKKWLNNFFDTKPANFYQNGIKKLIERWEQIVNNNGEQLLLLITLN